MNDILSSYFDDVLSLDSLGFGLGCLGSVPSGPVYDRQKTLWLPDYAKVDEGLVVWRP